MNKFSEYLLTCFKIGYVKKAPGTFGSLFALLCWCVISFFLADINIYYKNIIVFLLITILTLIGSFLAKEFQNFKNSDSIDNSAIILDEFVGQFISLQLSYYFLLSDLNNATFMLMVISSFILFRFFDITKPLIIGYLDKNMKNGFGVFLDDILAGIIAAIFTIMLFKAIFIFG